LSAGGCDFAICAKFQSREWKKNPAIYWSKTMVLHISGASVFLPMAMVYSKAESHFKLYKNEVHLKYCVLKNNSAA